MEQNSKKCLWYDFTNLYSISKTLRFELKPFGRTLEYIHKRGIVEQDKKRSEDFLRIKEVMDDYCRELIKQHLKNVNLDKEKLYKFKISFLGLRKNKNENKLKEDYKNIIIEIGKDLYNKAKFGEIKFDEKNFIKSLKKWLEENNRAEDLELLKSFDKFSTYFLGFFKNRENIFTIPEENEETISTSIVYRTINENLVKFLDNCLRFEELKEKIDFKELENNFRNELANNSLENFFRLENYNMFLTQEGIDIFNLIIGGKTLEDGTKLKGINEIINLYSQKEKDKNIKKKKLKFLDKQILSKSNKYSFFLPKIKDDKEFIKEINYIDIDNFNKIRSLFNKLTDYDLNQIYIRNDDSLTKISQDIFSDYAFLKKLIIDFKSKDENLKLTTEKKQEHWFNRQNYFSIKEIEEAILNKGKLFDLKEDEQRLNNKINNNLEHPIVGYLQKFNYSGENLFENLENSKKQIEDILNKNYPENTKEFLKQSKEQEIKKIKRFLDDCLEILHFIKLINYKKGNGEDYEILEVDNDFYGNNNEKESEGYLGLLEQIKIITKIYNRSRDYVSQKPFNTEKFKLNFENSTLAEGWDKNKESNNYAVLFRKEERYYLGILNKDSNTLFKEIPKNENEDFYEKMEYKLLPSPSEMLPKVFFSEKWKKEHPIPNNILEIYNKGTFKKGKDFNVNDCWELIDFYKQSIKQHSEWDSWFKFKFKPTKEYLDISEFYKDVEDQGFLVSFKEIDSKIINQYVNEGKLYLFEIYNKDFSKFSKGKKNLHTLYWNFLFSKKNLKDVVFKLNGKAQLFFREKSIREDMIIHQKNKPLKNKDPIKNKLESKFPYDLIKDRRYTEDKFQFHCPITINFKSKRDIEGVNKKINQVIKENYDNIKILGVDRGERNLVYYSLINKDGIIENGKQGSFNLIKDDFGRFVNYQKKLDEKEGERDEARKNFKNIKELKEGYLSQVIHQIAKIAIENNAIIVLENLNFGFKRGRFKIEKQIYQKFERMLIEKLNYLIFKDIEEDKPGGVSNGYQLTPKFESFKKLGKQAGILFYVSADYTSKIDPITGFVNLFNKSKERYLLYQSIEKSKEFFKNFDLIRYNKKEDYFEFKFDYKKFKISEEENSLPSKTQWIICSFGERLYQKRKENSKNWETIKIDLTYELKELFKERINYLNGEDIKEEILKQSDTKFFKELIFLIDRILQLRNSNSETGEDYILSCVRNENGEFFDSRKSKDNEPKDADANGAYNIARKGLIILKRIKDNSKKPDLKITNKDFLNFVNGNTP